MINVVLSADEKYFPGLYCVIGSVIQSSRDNFNFYVLDGGLSNLSKQKVISLLKRKSFQSQIFYIVPDNSSLKTLILRKEMTSIAYARLLIPELILESRVLYLDSDTLVFSDVAELWNDDSLVGEMLCAVADKETLCLADDSKKACDMLGVSPRKKYFNSGILLMDLDQLRSNKFSVKCIEFQLKYGSICRFHDQSPINFIYSDRIREIPLKWNTPVWLIDSKPWTKPSSILHYTNERPWLRDSGKAASYFFRKYAENF
jgi:lipopolysaccharide biosynthesis glycosyltransferase